MKITEDPQRLLRWALRGNAVFSAVSGGGLVAAAGPLSGLIGVSEPWVLRVTGVSLLIFAFGLLRNAARPDMRRGEAWLAVGLDFAWVMGSVALIAANLLTVTGNWAVAIVMDCVLVFAVIQFAGLRLSRKHSEVRP